MFEASPLKAKKWPFIKNERFCDCLSYVLFALIFYSHSRQKLAWAEIWQKKKHLLPYLCFYLLPIYAFYLLPFKEGEGHRVLLYTVKYIYGKAGRQNNSRQKVAWAEIQQKSSRRSGNSTWSTGRQKGQEKRTTRAFTLVDRVWKFGVLQL